MKRKSVEFEKIMILERLRIKKIKKNSMINTSNLPDDVIYEILIRLPHLSSAIQCSAVCKSWCSIINSNSNFITAFMNHLRSKVSPLTLLLGENFIYRNPIHINLPQRSSLSLNLTHVSSLVDSFPWLNNDVTFDSSLVAMCEDLLLVKKSTSYYLEDETFTDYYVCNPLTGQTFRLPDPPIITGDLIRCALVSEPNNNEKLGSCTRTRYRVMLIFQSRETYMTVFWSETEQWTEPSKIDLILSSVNDDVVACNGVLYWLGVASLIAFYPFESTEDATKQWRTIDLPDFHANVRLWLFQGRPRLSLLFRVNSKHLDLKVWDFLKHKSTDDDDGDAAKASLALVQDVRIEAADVDWISVFVLAFHPSHGNQIFLLRNRNLYQYEIDSKKQVKVAEIHSNYYGKMPELRVFPFVHPVRPTLI